MPKTPPAHHAGSGLLRWMLRLGPLGLFLVCVIDSSPVPLPIPGSSDLLLVFFAAQRHTVFWLTMLSTLGSAVGAFVSYQTGRAGGVALLDNYAPKALRNRLQRWSGEHALLSVALPAVLPPPAPLMPFLIAAGALRMPRVRFYATFVISRFLRHLFFAWLGFHFGRGIMRMYLTYADRYGWVLLVLVWGTVVFGAVYAVVQWRRSKKKAEPVAA